MARELRQEQSARMLARAQLDVLARELLAALPQDVEVVHEVIDDVSSKAIVEAARKTCASLIALPGAASDSGFRGLLSAVSPAAVALAASCSVLLLGSATPSPDPSATPVAPLLPH